MDSNQAFPFRNIKSNQLKTLTSDDIKGFESLQRVWLQDNIWICDCDIKPLAKYVGFHNPHTPQQFPILAEKTLIDKNECTRQECPAC